MIAGTTNGVNLTDGLDGLGAGTGIIAMLTFTAISVVTYIRSGNPGGRFDSRLDLAIVGAALIGATIGFLWYNAFPAEVIMGDTGAMAIGGALAAMAIFTQTIFLAPVHRRHLPDRGAVSDRAGDLVQVLRSACVPDGADPLPLRDEGVVGDEDHGALLDRHCDPLRHRFRALLPRLHLLPTLSEPGDIVVVIGAEAELIATLAAEVAPDGDVVVVDGSVDTLERLRHASPEPDVTYLVGESEVLPLPDESVDAVRTMSPPNASSSSEFFRVLRPGGQVSVGGSAGSALNVSAGMLTEAGFVDVAVVSDDGGPSLDARKP